MVPNPLLGVVFHWLGGLASGSFYVPYKGVRRWAWETYWLIGAFVGWILCPSIIAFLFTKGFPAVLFHQSAGTLGWTYFFGVLWGLGGLTFGLTMRYLGMSLGMGVALGYCAALGTLLPPLFKSFIPSVPVPETLAQIASSTSGRITLAGVAVCMAGIAVATLAGLAKERGTSREQKTRTVAEFNFRRGVLVATFSGVMSACFAFALTAGNPIGEASRAAGTSPIWSGFPKLVVVLVGGFTTNLIWCGILSVRNRTGYQYLARRLRPDDRSGGSIGSNPAAEADSRVPILGNYLLSALAGTTWYFQFFFYTMGETQMGKFAFASWTLHMASIIIFSSMWGWIFHEWKGSGRKAHLLIFGGLATLVLSTVVIGLGSYLKARAQG